tara:strand:+ start:487 stop:891 length:405 start_codon:yes stop_codon:yes gene_type:complete
MTGKELITWFKSLPDYPKYAKAIGEYIDQLGYAGPENSKVLSYIIPETLYGICCNLAFYQHDAKYEIGGTKKDRFDADVAMLGTALFIIENTPNRWYIWGGNGIRRRLAERRLLKYYNAVRWGGKSSFNFRDDK